MVVRRAALLIALAGTVAACSMPPVQADRGPELDGTVEARLQEAIAAAPFPLRLPDSLPEGFVLTQVDWIEGADDPARHGFSFDARYVGPDDVVLHVFQTNASAVEMGATDPVTLAGGDRTSIAGGEWMRVTLPNGDGTFNTQIARRFDGTATDELITLTIDAPSPEWVTLVAEALVETPSSR
jgi:hypothetical protein